MTEPPFSFATTGTPGRSSIAVRTAYGTKPLWAFAGRSRLDVPETVIEMLPAFDEWCDTVAGLLAEDDGSQGWLPDAEVRFLAPIPAPSAIYCAAATYADHMQEMGGQAGKLPLYAFLIPPVVLNGHQCAVTRPAGCEELDWEVELVVIIGSVADRVSEEKALDYVAGYTAVNDVTMRDHPRHPVLGVDWRGRKAHCGLTPMGPGITPARFVADPMDLDLKLTVNGQVRQQSNTAQMSISIAEQISQISQTAPLLPGDLLMTGTPAGTARGHGAG